MSAFAKFFFFPILLFGMSAVAAQKVPFYCTVFVDERIESHLTVFQPMRSGVEFQIDNPMNMHRGQVSETDETVEISSKEYSLVIEKDLLIGTLIVNSSGVTFPMQCEADVNIGR